MIQIVLIDDHPLAVNGIGTWLSGTGRFAVSGAAGSLADARSLLVNLGSLPDIIILDLSLGTEDGLEIIPALKEICAARKAAQPGILICSMYEDPFLIQRAFDAGASAYISKSADFGEIIAAIDAILAGKNYLDAKYQLQNPNLWADLTPRESEIVSLLKRSMNSRQIASTMGLSIRTIENHLAHIYVKTGTASRQELMEL